nr:MAG TPA: hypothetical protein [Bacteriophage sp.]
MTIPATAATTTPPRETATTNQPVSPSYMDRMFVIIEAIT